MSPPELVALQADYRRYLSSVVAFHLAAADHVGLASTEYEAANLLGIEGPLTAGELGRLLGLTTSATTRLIDRLEHAGLAVRRQDSADRRRVTVRATGQNPAGLGEALAHAAPRVQAAIADLDEHQLAGLIRYLQAAADAYREATHRLREASKET